MQAGAALRIQQLLMLPNQVDLFPLHRLSQITTLHVPIHGNEACLVVCCSFWLNALMFCALIKSMGSDEAVAQNERLLSRLELALKNKDLPFFERFYQEYLRSKEILMSPMLWELLQNNPQSLAAFNALDQGMSALHVQYLTIQKPDLFSRQKKTSQDPLKQYIFEEKIDDTFTRPYPTQRVIHGLEADLVSLHIDKHASALFDSLEIKLKNAQEAHFPYSQTDALKPFIRTLQLALSVRQNKIYTIVDKITQHPIGLIGYTHIRENLGLLELGFIHFSPQLKKTRAATDVVFLLLEYALFYLGYHACYWTCTTSNVASQRAAVRFGFTFCGDLVEKGLAIKRYVLTRDAWSTLREKFLQWLMPSNFDEDGHQKKKLRA
jgi:RimJ/RimL family protein N-acetyltransferase